MAWRNCVASIVLDQEVNARWPKRDNASDGTIGDAAHQSNTSDHNPWVKDRNGVGVVRARDIDEDLDGNTTNSGADGNILFNHLLGLAKRGDPRLNDGGYLIYEAKIYSIRDNWAARTYTGPNLHKKHLHASFARSPAGYDSNKSWGLLQPTRQIPTYKYGDVGPAVAFIADLGNILARAGFATNSLGKPASTQIPVPTAPTARAKYVYNTPVYARVTEVQRFGYGMWVLGGRNGPEPKRDGIFGPHTSQIFAFWTPLALQKL